MKIIALLSSQGTACAETALIDNEDTPANRERVERLTCTGYQDSPLLGTWTDCSDNEALWPEIILRKNKLTFLDKAEKALEELEGRGQLSSYAALAAVKELTSNWQAAIRDGASPTSLIGDIDDTINELRSFKSLIA